jgi:hypothetical protein
MSVSEPESAANVDSSAVVGPSKPRLLQVLGPGLITGANLTAEARGIAFR